MLQHQDRQHDVAKKWPLLGLLVSQSPCEEEQLRDVDGSSQHEECVHLQKSSDW